MFWDVENKGGFLIIDYLIQKRALSDLPDVENKGGVLIIGGGVPYMR